MSDPAQARSFGAAADRYDRYRPSYPDALVEWLADGATDVLDVGCGTGKLGRLLASKGCRVLGVEVDDRMAVVARGHGLDVEVAPFETWGDRGRRFDLVCSAQAWHWVDQRIGAERAAAVLRPGGRLAVVWNRYEHDPEVRRTLVEVHERFAPTLADSVPLGFPDLGLPLEGVDETGAFGPQQRRTDTWQRQCTAAEWAAELRTHSGHAALPPGELDELCYAVEAAVPARFAVTLHTLTIWATRT